MTYKYQSTCIFRKNSLGYYDIHAMQTTQPQDLTD